MEQVYDQVLATLPPKLLAKTAPALNQGYLDKLDSLKSLGAVVLILALKHQFSDKGYYWFNLPKTAGFPFLALVSIPTLCLLNISAATTCSTAAITWKALMNIFR